MPKGGSKMDEVNCKSCKRPMSLVTNVFQCLNAGCGSSSLLARSTQVGEQVEDDPNTKPKMTLQETLRQIGSQFGGRRMDDTTEWGFDHEPPVTDDGVVYVRETHSCGLPSMVVGTKTVVVRKGVFGVGRKTADRDIYRNSDAVWVCSVCGSKWVWDFIRDFYSPVRRTWNIKERTSRWSVFEGISQKSE